MRFVAGILAILVFVGTAFPVPTRLPVAAKAATQCHLGSSPCCKMKKPESKKEENKDCERGGCNPFSICNFCPIDPPRPELIPSAEFVILNHHFPPFSDDILIGFHPACWHPPNAA